MKKRGKVWFFTKLGDGGTPKQTTKQNIPNLLKGSSEELKVKERKKLEKRWEIRQHSEKVPLFLAHVEVGVAGKR